MSALLNPSPVFLSHIPSRWKNSLLCAAMKTCFALHRSLESIVRHHLLHSTLRCTGWASSPVIEAASMRPSAITHVF